MTLEQIERPADINSSTKKTFFVVDNPRAIKFRVCARHWFFLFLGLLIPVAATQMIVVNNDQVAFKQAPNHPLPGSCMSREQLGIPCPGCGLTRSTIHFFHGDWQKSFQVHHLGWLAILLIVAQVPYRIWKLAGFGRPRWKTDKWELAMGLVFVTTLFVDYLLSFALNTLN